MVLKCVGGIIFFTQHVPPKVVNLDGVIGAIVHVEDVLVFPRWVLLKLWPWETTPRGFGLALTVLNSLAWGAALAAARNFWRRATV